MSSYRFCRTDDIGLLVDALNRCWHPHFPDEEPVTPAAFKRSIRDLQVWCSSCMVAFSGGDPIGVLIGAKRASGTLIHQIAVHPDHLRQGHGRHLLTSLSSKLAILGPPRMVAEVPETFPAASALFNSCGYVEEAILTDYVWHGKDAATVRDAAAVGGDAAVEAGFSRPGDAPAVSESFVIPVTVDDLEANGLLGDEYPPTCWERSVQTLLARKDEIEGFAVASAEQIQAYILYIEDDVVALRPLAGDGAARLRLLLTHIRAGEAGSLRLGKVHPAEISTNVLASLGFTPTASHQLLVGMARSH